MASMARWTTVRVRTAVLVVMKIKGGSRLNGDKAGEQQNDDNELIPLQVRRHSLSI